MSCTKTLSIVATLALSLVGMDALAATSPVDITPPVQHQAASATYYIANAGTPQAHKVYNFNQLDRNHDGQLSRWEIPKDMIMLRARFIYADFNENGRLSPTEYIMWKEHTAPLYAIVGGYPVFTVVSD